MAFLFEATTELEAVNIILKNDGEAPVATLDENGFSPAQEAQAVLHETSRRLQLKGWDFNTDKSRPFTPDVDGFITLGLNVLSVRSPSGQTTTKQRGTRLYDAAAFTYVFTAVQTLNAITFLPWTEMPEYARDFITIKAARLYQKRETSSDLIDSFTAEEQQRAWAAFRRSENRAEKPNMLKNSNISAALSGRNI